MSKKTNLLLIPAAVAAVAVYLADRNGQYLVNAFTSEKGFIKHEGLSYGPLSRQKLDVYIPDKPAPHAPVVVFFYGGRWEEGERAGYKFVAQALTSIGCIAVVADYRLYPEVKFPSFVEDGAKAVKWVHDHIEEYGGNLDHLYIMGHSAGAYISAMLALDGRYLEAEGACRDWLAGMIGMAGPYDFHPQEAEDLRDIFGPPSQYPQTQPINYVDANAPPALLLQGKRDRTVPPKNTRGLASKLETAGVPVQARYYPTKAHISLIAALAAPLRFTGKVLDDIDAFINKN